jgi:phospholipid transport system substrate-binding protein
MLQTLLSRRPLFMLLTAACIGLFASLFSARAAEADSFIRQVGNETLKALEDRSLTQDKREALLRNLLTTHLDLEAVGRFCLGRYSRNLTEAQRPEYQKLFEDYLVKVYAQLLAQYDGQVFEVREGVRSAGTESIVDSQIIRQAGPPIRVEWKVHEKNGKPLVTDVIVEGVSMAFTQRQQFESVIQNNGGKIEALFSAMQRQIARR